MATTIPPTPQERDPVCGMNVNPATAKHVHEHAGKKYYFCCASCAEKFKANPEQSLNKPSLVTLGMPTKPQPILERDPVCGMNVNPATAKHVHEHAGKKVYFCSAGCLEKFRAHPEKYLPMSAPGIEAITPQLSSRAEHPLRDSESDAQSREPVPVSGKPVKS